MPPDINAKGKSLSRVTTTGGAQLIATATWGAAVPAAQRKITEKPVLTHVALYMTSPSAAKVQGIF